MTSLIAGVGSGRSTSVIPAVPAASSVTTIAFIRGLPVSSSRWCQLERSEHPEVVVGDHAAAELVMDAALRSVTDNDVAEPGEPQPLRHRAQEARQLETVDAADGVVDV